MFLKEFFEDESGAAVTIDWLVLLGGLTATGLMVVEVSTGALGGHSQTIRGELQDNHFETAWIDYLPVGASGQTPPDVSDTSNRPARGNNGHGNNYDSCDSSNPGRSPNCVEDPDYDDEMPRGRNN
ncbi:hypothetical protein P6F26_15190 [Roseibacterium sp. SDUM158017]|uniref:hypothetical protein n=1 Tax=Roseicyclus salinarum TaxID=3036773 RepID=UPI0024151C0C|nr:hypothetical protein [Roseibacterium sp. SDUM158017]MDG4649788.1 hypothetical protein [Roseibacterium sp. SDUM158017]